MLPPRLTASNPNPTQQLDFKRFSSDVLKDHLRADRDADWSAKRDCVMPHCGPVWPGRGTSSEWLR